MVSLFHTCHYAHEIRKQTLLFSLILDCMQHQPVLLHVLTTCSVCTALPFPTKPSSYLHHSLTVQAESYKGQTAQLEKELVRLTAVLQQDELKITSGSLFKRKRMPSWNNCFPKTKAGYWLRNKRWAH